ncbi:uncharacterized protein si:dkey-30j10.5 [Periophthalmus magnuspinnatus]|uniref:uncharacterized protein si:dkey-30j10.5 n=1 Tax=Periophthalmus magnuspinnatus TaxID=409849 RepID=UPI002436EEEF|nr:uncharacterized protein si:dkey-30j10.5 [Periophthalmus magnuspinnatus]
MASYITDIAVSLNQAEEQNLQARGFKKINVSLNPGGNPVHIWYKKNPEADPITRIQVSFEDGMCDGLINAGYTKVNRNLSTGGEVFLWYFSSSTEFDTNIVRSRCLHQH